LLRGALRACDRLRALEDGTMRSSLAPEGTRSTYGIEGERSYAHPGVGDSSGLESIPLETSGTGVALTAR
jgi:hypothetical protein